MSAPADVAASAGDVHVVVPAGIDDPARPSGGNIYDGRICRGLADAGWAVHEHHVTGAWPWPDAADRQRLATVLAAIPDGSLLLIDGLIASTIPDLLVPTAGRLRLVVLLHMALGDGPAGHRVAAADERERVVLSAAAVVLTTSAWTRDRLASMYGLAPELIRVAQPGVDAAALAAGTTGGGQLLCVAAVAAHKGHDVLVSALAPLAGLSWRCICVGSLEREPSFVARIRLAAAESHIADRVVLAGARIGPDLGALYHRADVLVLPTLGESYGMVVTEALARGLPVIATDVGGVSEALGRTADGRLPGLLVQPGDPAALSAAIERWLREPGLRARLRSAARERRMALHGWAATTEQVARALRLAAP